jgi:beta-N-acetylhexosaminidase
MNTIRGPVIADLTGLNLTQAEEQLLLHPYLGGIILFSRNYQNISQLKKLIGSIRSIRPELLICVDQEGGRVQRLVEDFTQLPPLHTIGQYADEMSWSSAKKLAHLLGYLMAKEVRAIGIDLSFAPVLDLNRGISEIIGNRAIHRDPSKVYELALDYIQGMHEAGMPATGKHFPGHGSVEIDSHLGLPIDNRDFDEIEEDMFPFAQLAKKIDAIMPAHIVFPKVDEKPVGFSKMWLKQILRQTLQFEGIIFSDDLTMEGAAILGDYPTRAISALEAGCDFILVCNNPEGAKAVLRELTKVSYSLDNPRISRFAIAQPDINWENFISEERIQLQKTLSEFV